MATKAGVGFSEQADAKEAGKEACRSAMKEVKDPELLVVFSSVKYDQEEILGGIREFSNDTPLIGCSDAGEIVGSKSTKGGVAVMAISSNTIKFTTGFGGKIIDGAWQAGAALAKDIKFKANEEVNCYVVLTDVLTGNGADIVRGVQDVAGKNALIIGGAAGDDFKFKQTYVYHNDKVHLSSIVGVGLTGAVGFGVGVRHGWIPIGLPKKVTKSHGAVLEELDGRPAVSIYEDHFGKKADELRQEPLATMAITYPLGMSVKGSDEYLIRDPITVDEKGAITCAAEIPDGSELRLMIGSKEDAVEAAKDAARNALATLDGKKPKAIIMFNCIARNKLLGRHADDEIKAIQQIFGGEVPLIGFYTYGEQAPLGGNLNPCFSCFHNGTAVILALGD